MLVSAPAGTGKTTFVASWCLASASPVAWYRIESRDGSETAFLAHLSAAIASATGESITGWTTVSEAVADIDRRPGKITIVLDDLHEVHETPAELAIAEFLAHLPHGCTTIIATRRAPSFDLSLLRVAGLLVEITADDLRFRSWEIERLFADIYSEPLRPDELALLERKTDGWAAGLQLFHLATTGKSLAERRATLGALGTRSPTVHDYLARNVMRDLPPDLLSFLLDTCVLTWMTPDVCDRLRGSNDSQERLQELAARNVFTVQDVANGSYHYHEIFRTHLEARLLEELGEADLRMTFRAAGKFFESEGLEAEAVRAYSRAGDQDEVERLLFSSGEELADEPGLWLDALPPAVRDEDPWVLLARARQLTADGQLAEAVRRYDQAMERFGTAGGAEICPRERSWVAMWLGPKPYYTDDWRGSLRALIRSGPSAVRNVAGDAQHINFVAGIRELLIGNETTGLDRLASSSAHIEASTLLSASAELISVVIPGIFEAPDSDHLDALAERFRTIGFPWGQRVSLAARALDADIEHVRWADTAAERAAVTGDRWLEVFARSFAAVGRLRAGDGDPDEMGELALTFRQLEAGPFEPFLLVLRATAAHLIGSSSIIDDCRHADGVARLTGSRSVQALGMRVQRVSVSADPREVTSTEHLEPAGSVDNREFLRSLGVVDRQGSPTTSPSATKPVLVVRCLGRFDVSINDEAADVGRLKPRVRSLLCVLMLHEHRPIHRDQIVAALWPNSTEPAALRSQQVAVSALRKFFEPDAPRGTSGFVVRCGDSYQFALPPGSSVDLHEFTALLATARTGTDADSVSALRGAVDLYGGALFPDEGIPEWVLAPRREYANQAAGASGMLARLLGDSGDNSGAAAACRSGLRIDRYRDDLWQTLILALEQGGERVEGARARSDYDELLAELGLNGG